MMLRGHGTRLLAFLFLFLTMLLPMANPAAAAGPDLRLRPNDGLPGESIVVRGRDFMAGSSGVVTWESVTEPLAEFTADGTGEFEITITVPDLAAGS